MKKIFLTAVVAVMALLSCKKDNDGKDDNSIIYGDKVTVGNGSVRSFLSNADDPAKMELGLEMEEAAFENLPHLGEEFLINLPAKALQITPYKHISMNWAHVGHGPQGVYDKSHFDIHFFMVGRDEQNAISASSPDLQKLPDSTFLPEFYFPEPGGIDLMGKHWADVTSPELNPVNPSPFTSTMVYGTYNAKVVFLEPMVTKDFLQSKPDTIMNIRQPHSLAVSSNYPEKYKIHSDAASGKVFVTLTSFKFREKHLPGHP